MIHALLLVSALIWADNAGDDAAKAGPLEGIAKAGVGLVVSKILDVPASVGGVRLDLKKQFLELSDVKVGNPKKFSENDAIFAKKVRVEADPKSLFSEEPTIRLIQVSGGTVNAEQTLAGGMNLKKLLDNVTKLKGAKPSKGESKKKWRIEKAVLDDCTANVTTELPIRQTTQKKLDHTELNLAGNGGNGLTSEGAISRVLETLIDKTGTSDGNAAGATGAAGAVAPLMNLLGK